MWNTWVTNLSEQSLKFSFILSTRNHQQQIPDKHIIPVDSIYPWTHDFIWRQTSAFQSFTTLVSQKYLPNLQKSLHWHIENRESIEDLLREVDEDSISINNGEFQSNDVMGTFGKAFCGAFTGRCSQQYFANSRKNNFQIEKEYFVDKLIHTNPRVPSL